MREPDQIYATPQHIVDFQFDHRVTAVFPDMIRRSVPGYGEIISMLGLFAERYVQPGSRIYDLGCSLGASTLSLRERLHAPGCRIIAVDNSESMVEGCRHTLTQQQAPTPVEVINADIRAVPIEDASLVVLNFTLQFIPLSERLLLLSRIYAGLRPGGALILSEKVIFDDPTEGAMQESLQLGFKQANGYSELEISQKRAALEQVLSPESLATHHQRLQQIGFTTSITWFQCFNFTSIIALK